jgi:hypothetical protein
MNVFLLFGNEENSIPAYADGLRSWEQQIVSIAHFLKETNGTWSTEKNSNEPSNSIVK